MRHRTGKESILIRRGYIVLIIGGVLFVAGIIIAAVWAVPFVSMFLQENTLIKEVSIEPGESVEATTLVTDVSRPITVAIHIERSGGAVVTDEGQQQQQVPQEQAVMRLIETVKDPSGTVVSSNEFSSNLFTTFQPRNGGNHVLNITNAGSRSVAIDATFGYMPFITSAAPPPSEGGQRLPGVGLDLSSLSAVIAGGVLSVIGFFTIIAGIIIVVIDSRKRRGEEQKGSGVTEGGITYRKD
jgi:uncharacterized membrane protein